LQVIDPDGRRLIFHEQTKDAGAAARMEAMFDPTRKAGAS
jgi:hypothetical protein